MGSIRFPTVIGGLLLAVVHGTLALLSEGYEAIVGGIPATILVGTYRDLFDVKMEPMTLILYAGQLSRIVLLAEGVILFGLGAYLGTRFAKRREGLGETVSRS